MHRKTFSRALFWMVAATLMVCGQLASAQDYPSRPIRIVVPYPPGSITDVVARLLANALSERLKQSTIIENRTGAGGIVAMKSVQQATPDGYTLGVIASGNIIQPWLMKEMPFDVRKDFMPLTMLYAAPFVMTVSPSFPPADFQSFLAYVRANPNKVFFGSSGVGTTTHLAAELMKQAFALDLVHVPFRGSPEAYTAMLGGQVSIYFDVYGTARQHIESGRVRALAFTGRARHPALPQVPALAELSPGFNVFAWAGFAAPLGTPRDVVDKLESALRASFKSPEVMRRLNELGVEPGGSSSAEFLQFMNEEYEKWGKAIKAAGLKQE